MKTRYIDRLPREPLTFRIDSDLKKKLKELAKVEHRTNSYFINLAVHEFLEQRDGDKPLSIAVAEAERLKAEAERLKKVRRDNAIAILLHSAKDLLATIEELRNEESS